jgi:putative methionine-R-sulfoxide reductase with GAF domain
MNAVGATAGAVWIDDADGTLRCLTFLSFAPVQVFEYQTKSMHFPVGTGLPGRVAANRKVEWIHDVTADDNFPRVRGALQGRLRGAVAFPITAGENALGAVELFSRAALTEDAAMDALLVDVGKQLAADAEIVRFLRE